MKFWINAILFELTWVSAVAGAARGWWWAGPLAVSVFALWQLRRAQTARGDVPLIVLALLIGFVADSLLAQSGLLRYAAAEPWAAFAPIWILALWVNLALTLNHSLAFLKARAWLAALLGGISAPLSYWAAAHGWGALTFAAPAFHTLLVIGLGWAVALPVLSQVARLLSVEKSAQTIGLAERDPR